MDADAEGPSYISKGLRHLAYPVADLTPLPNNPRKGKVEAVAASYRAFGQRKPIVARHDVEGIGVILAGNTQWRAAQMLGWEYIAVEWADDDTEEKAVAFALTDNRTHDLGEYEDQLLVEAWQSIEDPALRAATGYDLADIQEMMEGLDPARDFQEAAGGGTVSAGGVGNPVIQSTIVWDDEEQQQQWFRWVRWLKRTFPDEETLAARIALFLEGLSLEDVDAG